MPEPSAPPKVSLAAFFALWAESRRWEVPDIHWRIVHWLEHRGSLAVLRVFRGAGKSTLLAIYNAWRFYVDPTYRILHQSEADGTAYKTSRDTQAVLRQHPLTRDLFRDGGVEQWWVVGATDPRNASMYAKGILSNVTSARADEAQNDDVEVPRNIQTPEAREKLRYRLGEQTFILVPGGRTLYVGTPHTHDSLYDEQQALGADCLTIRLFAQEHRVENAAATRYTVPFRPEYVFAGIGKGARLLRQGVDYVLERDAVRFSEPPAAIVDFYAGCAWPERFTRDDLLNRRRKTRTINYWDSQYQLHSKPITETRLDPDRIAVYDVEPVMKRANGETLMLLGKVRIVGAALRWDPSSGKKHSDVSALALCLQDEDGRRYLHRIERASGDVAVFAADGKTITGGQVAAVCDLVEKFALSKVTVETNGIGQFAPSVLKAALKQRRLACGVKEDNSTQNKNRRILEALEPLILSRGMIWMHSSVADGPLPDQMRQWTPAVENQEDDYLDAAAGAVVEQPERVGRRVEISDAQVAQDWRPSTGVHEVELEL